MATPPNADPNPDLTPDTQGGVAACHSPSGCAAGCSGRFGRERRGGSLDSRLSPHPNLKPYLEEAEVGDGTEGGDKEGRGLGTSVWKDPVSIPAPGTIGGVASRALLDLELDEDSLQEEIRLIKQGRTRA